MIYFLVAFTISILTTWLIIHTEHFHYIHTHDNDFSGIQKFHEEPVPRIGGIAILAGLLIGSIYLGFHKGEMQKLLIWIGIASAPAFMGGFIEDITKKVSPGIRLSLAFVSASVAFFFMDFSVMKTTWGWLDQQVPVISFLITLLAVGGITNGTNIIDGFNGLLLGYSILVLGVLGFVCFQINDVAMLDMILIFIGSICGLFIFNFPRGRIFTGDGGAYLIGFLLVTLSFLIVKRNEEISPWLPFLILIHPIFETLFSMYRRSILRGKSPFKPDSIHLHTLIHRRVIPQLGEIAKKHHNPITSVLIWGIVMASVIPAIIWWENSFLLIVFIFFYCFLYIWIYLRIIRFNY
ncbi:glycosyl transferase family 4 [Chloroherpeton thalassium ATCC 35110]|uniref:Glycosyl transferase family 4 n=1 Tax=Chloroherpeton thalassium (strain ATCC 35110 / GB-78) TaxID=517418 RepID=B3QV14_CHLT3|nr:glycosyltransferase [Chloroherpeton thalassium]ACF14515.1 glycosyl transferase family 4 [Chloroherpeton thalassium ATCC 35110]